MDEQDDIPHQPIDLLTAMRFGVDYTFTVKVRNLELKVRPLSVVERIEVVNDTREQVSQMKEHARTELVYLSILAMRTLEMATTPEPRSQVKPRITVAVLERMTNDEVTALYQAYIDGCDRVDPSVETLSDTRLGELVNAAKKKAYNWTELPRPHLEQLARYLLTRDESPEASTLGGSSTPSLEAGSQ